VTTELPVPSAGQRLWWSGDADDLTSTMSRQVTLPAGAASLQFQARWNIEDCAADPCDYAFVEVDTGSGWRAIPGSITNAAEGNGIDGLQDEWVQARFDLSEYAGRTIGLRFRYATDGAVRGQDREQAAGLFLDEIVLRGGGRVLLSDGAENGDNSWALDGFTATGSSFVTPYDHFYLASNREYVAFDQYLESGPYNFGFPDRPVFAEHFPYQDGLLVWYWDTSVPDNDTSVHPGEGLILPVDSHPGVLYDLEGAPWRGRIQTFDAPFGLQKVDSFTLHVNGKESYVRGRAGNPTFDDSRPNRYFKPALPSNGVRVAGTGTTIRVLRESGTSVSVRIDTTAFTTP